MLYDTITDVPGIRVGHYTDTEAVTGCTVVLATEGAVAGVDVRGAAPGTRETDLLRPLNLVREAHAVHAERQAILRDIRKATGALSARFNVLLDGQPVAVEDESGGVLAQPDALDGGSAAASGWVKATANGRTFRFDVEVRLEE